MADAPKEDEVLTGSVDELAPEAVAAPAEPEKAEDPKSDEVEVEAKAAEPKPAATPEPAVAVAPASPAVPADRPKTVSELRLIELETKIDAEDFDPYSKDGKAIIKEHAKVAAKVEFEPLQAQLHDSTVWQNLSDDHDIPVKDLKVMWAETVKSMPEKHKGNQGAMDYAFEQRIAAAKAEKAEPEAKPDKPTTKAKVPIQTRPGAVSPVVAIPHRPPAPGSDPAEDFAKSVSREELATFIV